MYDEFVIFELILPINDVKLKFAKIGKLSKKFQKNQFYRRKSLRKSNPSQFQKKLQKCHYSMQFNWIFRLHINSQGFRNKFF